MPNSEVEKVYKIELFENGKQKKIIIKKRTLADAEHECLGAIFAGYSDYAEIWLNEDRITWFGPVLKS